MEDLFKNKTFVITGGTGSFGNAVVEKLLVTEAEEIRIFSRDEKKQDDMRHIYGSSRLKFFIGDVKDISTVRPVMQGADYVFHAAALKQVPSCEFFPLEAVKTNVMGTENVLDAAVDARVDKVVCLSTDKAAYPVNAMGISKAMMEKVIIAKSRSFDSTRTKICCTRYGNVMASRGSVIPLFIEQIKAGRPLTITEASMTRFIMSLDEAVALVLYAFENGLQGDLFVQKADAAKVGILAQAIKELFGVPDYPCEIIGIRHGEKTCETLLTNEECVRAIDCGDFYRVVADGRDLNYEKYLSRGDIKRSELKEFNSDNTTLLDVEGTRKKLMTCRLVMEELQAWEECRDRKIRWD